MKNKKDLQAFMREKLAKTKISSEATSNIQPIAQSQKNFTGQRSTVNSKPDDVRSSVQTLPASGGGAGARSGTAEKPNFYKPNLLKPKESSNYMSGPAKPLQP